MMEQRRKQHMNGIFGRQKFLSLIFGIVLALLPLGHISAGTSPASADPYNPVTLSDSEIRARYLDMLENFVAKIEGYYRESDIPESNTGRYIATGPGVTQPRGSSNISIIYALLLMEYPNKEMFSSQNISRETMLDHLIQNIRYNLLTNKGSGKGYNRWGGGTWQASLELYPTALAAHLVWGRLDQETKDLVHKVLAYEADILITKAAADATPGNTGAEDNGWNAPTPALAAAMFPDDPNAAKWVEAANRHAMNATSVPMDHSDDTIVDGKPVNEWVTTTNFLQDWTLENHGFFNPIYEQVAPMNVGEAMTINLMFNKPVPQAFQYHTKDIWENVLSRIATNDGDLLMINGQDWVSKDYQHFAFFAMMGTIFHKPEATALESRAIQLLQKRQGLHADGSYLGSSDLGYETMLGKRMAFAYLMHKHGGPSDDSIQVSDLMKEIAGTYHYPDSDFVVHRTNDKIASFSWGDRPMGTVLPLSTAYDQDPIFTYYDTASIVGDARTGKVGEHHYNLINGGGFSTAGQIGSNQISMTSLPNQTTLLFDHGNTRTFYYSVEMLPGVTGERPIYYDGGQTTFGNNITGDWVNIADRIGMVVKGGAGISTGTSPVAQGSKGYIWGSNGKGTGNRAAVLYNNVDHSLMESLASSVTQLDLSCGWNVLFADAPDGTLSFAVVNQLGKRNVSTVEYSTINGAPVFKEISWVTGNSTMSNFELNRFESEGQVINSFITSDNGEVQARKINDTTVRVTNPNERSIAIRVKFREDHSWIEQNLEIPAGEARDVAPNFVTNATPDPIEKPEVILKCDEVAPETSAQIQSDEPISADGWYHSDVYVNLSAHDMASGDAEIGSGVAQTNYRLDGGTWQTYNGNMVISTPGEHLLNYYSIDSAGNVETVKKLLVKIDKTAPNVDHTIEPQQPDGTNGWYTSSVKLNLSANDVISTSNEEISLNPEASFASSNQNGYPPSLAIDKNAGTFWVSGGTKSGEGPTVEKPIYYGVDFGRKVNIHSMSLTPRVNYGPKTFSVQISDDGLNYQTILENATNENSTKSYDLPDAEARFLRLEITASRDPVVPSRNVQIAELAFTGNNNVHSGVNRIEYQWDDGQWVSYQSEINITADGSHTLTYRAVDKADNDSETKHLQFRIDRTAPEIIINIPENAAYQDSEQLILNAEATDVTSSVYLSNVTLDGSPIRNGDEINLWLLPLGDHTITVSGTDNAGNSAFKEVHFTTTTDLSSLQSHITRESHLESLRENIVNSLVSTLEGAQSALDRGSPDVVINQLNAFKHEVTAQRGKGINEEVADLLLRDAEYIQQKLQ